MSLLDALLLDPAPFDVWIAARTDGIKGSGTASDPYNGTPSIKITQLSRVGTTLVAEAIVAAGHGLQNSDLVVVSGAEGGDAIRWNGAFSITNVTSTSFRYTMSAPPISSSAVGQPVVAKVASSRMDELLSALPANTRVHLGPGTFLTSGYQVGGSTGWQLKTGLKIVGAGMEVTKLQLTGHSASNYFYVAGHDLSAGVTADFCEISDLTLDCALGTAGTTTACGGVRLMGNHTRIHRVRVINWGSKDAAKAVSALSCSELGHWPIPGLRSRAQSRGFVEGGAVARRSGLIPRVSYRHLPVYWSASVLAGLPRTDVCLSPDSEASQPQRTQERRGRQVDLNEGMALRFIPESSASVPLFVSHAFFAAIPFRNSA